MYEMVGWEVRETDEAGAMCSVWGSPSRGPRVTAGYQGNPHTPEGDLGTFQEANQSRSSQRCQGLAQPLPTRAYLAAMCQVPTNAGAQGSLWAEQMGKTAQDTWYLKPWGGPGTGHLAPRVSVSLYGRHGV